MIRIWTWLKFLRVISTWLFSGLMLASLAVAAAPRPPTPVFVIETKMAKIEDRIEALSTLHAKEAVELTASVTEIVTAINFDDGKAGWNAMQRTTIWPWTARMTIHSACCRAIRLPIALR